MAKLTEILPDVFVVEVPKDAKDIKFDFVDWQLCYTVTQQSEPFIGLMCREVIILPQGTWQYLGYCTKDEISFDVSELVERGKIPADLYYIDYCWTGNKDNERFDKLTANSLLLKHGFDSFNKLVVLKKIK